MDYTVKKGDSLSAIALRFKVPIRQLAADNNITNIGKIYRGQVLKVPDPVVVKTVEAPAKVSLWDQWKLFLGL